MLQTSEELACARARLRIAAAEIVLEIIGPVAEMPLRHLQTVVGDATPCGIARAGAREDSRARRAR